MDKSRHQHVLFDLDSSHTRESIALDALQLWSGTRTKPIPIPIAGHPKYQTTTCHLHRIHTPTDAAFPLSFQPATRPNPAALPSPMTPFFFLLPLRNSVPVLFVLYTCISLFSVSSLCSTLPSPDQVVRLSWKLPHPLQRAVRRGRTQASGTFWYECLFLCPVGRGRVRNKSLGQELAAKAGYVYNDFLLQPNIYPSRCTWGFWILGYQESGWN